MGAVIHRYYGLFIAKSVQCQNGYYAPLLSREEHSFSTLPLDTALSEADHSTFHLHKGGLRHSPTTLVDSISHDWALDPDTRPRRGDILLWGRTGMVLNFVVIW